MSFILETLRQKRGLRRYIGPKRVALLLVLAAFVVWAWTYHGSGGLGPAFIDNYRSDHPLGSVLLFVLVYTVFVLACLPSLPLNLAAGYYWGGVLGGFYTTAGVTLGGWIAFAAARWLIGQPLAARFDHRILATVQQEFARHGWKFVAFARLNPVIPTGVLNYLLGLTALSGRVFLWATFVFLLPPSIAVAYIGDTLKTFVVEGSGAGETVRTLLGVSAAVTVLAALKFAFRIFRK